MVSFENFEETVFDVLWNPMRIRKNTLNSELLELISMGYKDNNSPIEVAIIIRDLYERNVNEF